MEPTFLKVLQSLSYLISLRRSQQSGLYQTAMGEMQRRDQITRNQAQAKLMGGSSLRNNFPGWGLDQPTELMPPPTSAYQQNLRDEVKNTPRRVR